MPESGSTGRNLPAVVVLGLAAALRILAVAFIDLRSFPNHSWESWQIAGNMVAGHGFSFNWYGLFPEPIPSSFIPPLYPYLVRAALAVTGSETAAVYLVQALHVVLGVASVAICMRLMRRIAGEPAALVAGVLLAVYPPILGHLTQVQTQTVEIFLMLACLDRLDEVLRSTSRRAAIRTAIWGGIWGGLLIEVRPTFLVLLPILAAVVYLASRERAAVRGALIALAVAALVVVLPWTVRNAVVHRAFVPVSTNGGFAFMMGNNEDSNGGVGDINRFFRDLPADQQQQMRSLSEPERNRRLWKIGFDFWRDQPAQAIRLTFVRMGYFLWFRPYLLKAQYPTLFAYGYMGSYALLCLFFVLGLKPAAGNVRNWALPATIVVGIFLLTVPFAISVRYRAIIEPLMILFAAVPVARILQAAGLFRNRQEP